MDFGEPGNALVMAALIFSIGTCAGMDSIGRGIAKSGECHHEHVEPKQTTGEIDASQQQPE